MTANITNAIAALDNAQASLNELQTLLDEQTKKHAAELREMLANSDIPIFCSSNLQPHAVSILVGEELWKLLVIKEQAA
jgi:hypothetical protein